MTSDVALLRLKHAVQALVATPDVALSIYPDFACKVDELALDFDHWLRVASSLQFTERQKQALARLDERLATMSGEVNAELWTEDALRDKAEWNAVREDARAVLAAFGWAVDDPPKSPDVFVPATW